MPGYHNVAAHLRARIADGTYPPGSNLPASKVIEHEFSVGRDVAIDALRLLEHEGLVSQERGRLTRVRDEPVRQALELAPGTEVVARMPSPAERDQLDIGLGVPILEIWRGGECVQVVAADRWKIAS